MSQQSVSQRATAGKERQTAYEYKKVLSRPTPVYPLNFWGRSPRRNERPYNENKLVVTNALCKVHMFLVLIYKPNKLTCMLLTVQNSTVGQIWKGHHSQQRNAQ